MALNTITLLITIVLALYGCGPQHGVKVLTIKKNNTEKNDSSLINACNHWSLTPAQIDTVFTYSRTLNEGEQHSFYHLPCSLEGTLLRNDSSFIYTINAAATVDLFYRGNIYAHYGCYDQACARYFLLMPDSLK